MEVGHEETFRRQACCIMHSGRCFGLYLDYPTGAAARRLSRIVAGSCSKLCESSFNRSSVASVCWWCPLRLGIRISVFFIRIGFFGGQSTGIYFGWDNERPHLAQSLAI